MSFGMIILWLKRLTIALMGLATTAATEVVHSKEPSVAPEPAPALTEPALRALSDEIAVLHHQDQFIGGELLVVDNGEIVLQRSYGWMDRDARRAMPLGALYCVRSMTKPLIGTAVQMLIDEGMISLDTVVADILPAFAEGGHKSITIKHLLTHSSGLPLTTLNGGLQRYNSVLDVANEAANSGLLFEPGSQFQYSDTGTDTLGAIVESVSGMELEQFIQQRLTNPLGMNSSVTVVREGENAMANIPTAYSGGAGGWTRHWGPGDEPIFPLFLASQGLYTTTEDYARFLSLWLDNGWSNGKRLLSESAIQRGLRPAFALTQRPSELTDLSTFYAQHWRVHARDSEEQTRVFGHSGSDGTFAWAWPEHDLMVLFFTQSRGTTVGLAVERAIQHTLFDRESGPTNKSVSSTNDVDGVYWDEDKAHAYYQVRRQDGMLTIVRPGSFHLQFKPTEMPGKYEATADLRAWVAFEPDPTTGQTVMKTFLGKRTETQRRLQVDPSLPSVGEINHLVRNAHNLDGLDDTAVVLRGDLEMLDRGITGEFFWAFDDSRQRTEQRVMGNQSVLVSDGSQAWSKTRDAPARPLQGALLEQALLDHPAAIFGDWTNHYRHLKVAKRVQHDDRNLLLVLAQAPSGIPSTLFVEEATGQLVRIDRIALIPGIGRVGVQTVFSDFREIDTIRLPGEVVNQFATPLIGRIRLTVNDFQTRSLAEMNTALTPPD